MHNIANANICIIISNEKGLLMKTSSIEYAILELLEENNSHLKAHEVYEHLHLHFPSVNPSTVYRALDRLAHAGKISVSDMGTGASVYEKVTDGMHHHLVCQVCGRVLTMDHKSVKGLFTQIETEFSFRIVTNHLILFGVCPECEASQKERGSNDNSKSSDC
jgi:Fur family ferric uptake transcriptional regulator